VSINEIRSFERRLTIIGGGKLIYDKVMRESSRFSSAIELAKKSGKLLAYLICLDYPQAYHKVDLIGFSLGTQVIKSCLTQLKKIRAYKMVDSVYLMGGAT